MSAAVAVRRVGCALFWTVCVFFVGSAASWAGTVSPPASGSFSLSSGSSTTSVAVPTLVDCGLTPEDPSCTPSPSPTPTAEPTPAPVTVQEVTLSNDQFQPLLLVAGVSLALLGTLVVLTIGAHGD